MGKKINLDKQDLLAKYPQYKGRKNVDIQRWTMFPIGIKSDHHGEQVTFTKNGAESIINKVKDMPVMYVDGEYIPTKHRNESGNRKVVGTTVGGGIYTDETGTEWAYADTLIYTDVEKGIYDTIMENKDEMATSIEAEISVDDFLNIQDADYEGLSLLSKNNSAWQTQLLVADKGEATTIEVKYDDLIKQVVGDDYNSKLADKDKLIEDAKAELQIELDKLAAQIIEKEELINGLNTENNSLRELNTKFSRLIK